MNRPERPRRIGPRLLHRQVVQELREMILACELAPRSRINEPSLCERFGISRTPLREAIKLLAAEGLLELLPNRGARVAALSEAEIDELLQVIGPLEATGGELACERITDAELEVIEAAHLDMVEAWKIKDYERYFTRNREIHDAIVAAGRNGTLLAVYRNLSGRVQRARYLARKTDAQWARSIEDHGLMLILLRRRDGKALAQLMLDHSKNTKTIVSAAYSVPEQSKRTKRRRVSSS